MTSPPFDTLELSAELQRDGHFQKDQAEALTRALAKVAYQELATKRDLKDLEQRLTIRGSTGLVLLGGFLTVIKYFG